jgi:hypothetical protein
MTLRSAGHPLTWLQFHVDALTRAEPIWGGALHPQNRARLARMTLATHIQIGEPSWIAVTVASRPSPEMTTALTDGRGAPGVGARLRRLAHGARNASTTNPAPPAHR